MYMNESILETVKKLIGCPEDQNQFDTDLVLHTNAAFSTLNHLGVGPKDGFRITGSEETWDAYNVGENELGLVKDYVYMKVRLVFDPPASGSLMDNLKEQLREVEQRLFMMAEVDNEKGEGNGIDKRNG